LLRLSATPETASVVYQTEILNEHETRNFQNLLDLLETAVSLAAAYEQISQSSSWRNPSPAPSPKGLVDADVGDGQAEGIDWNGGIGDAFAQDEGDARGGGFTEAFLARAGRVVDTVEVDGA
jgi:hypothetical protein